MNTAIVDNRAAQNSSSDYYDADEALPRNSPLLMPRRVNLRLSSPSPPPPVPLSSFKTSQGDAVLIHFMDGGKNPHIAATAGTVALPSPRSSNSARDDTDPDTDTEPEEEIIEPEDIGRQTGAATQSILPSGARMSLDPSPPWTGGDSVDLKAQALAAGALLRNVQCPSHDDANGDRMVVDLPSRPAESIDTGTPEAKPPDDNSQIALQSLASSALGNLASRLSLQEPELEAEKPARTIPANIDIEVTRERANTLEPRQAVAATPREAVPRDDRSVTAGAPSPFSNSNPYSPRQQILSPINHVDLRSPGALPPMQGMGSPRSDTNGSNALPSIREQLGDLRSLPPELSDPRQFPHSPPGTMPRLPSMSHGSPPVSPNDMFRRDIASPTHIPGHVLAVTSPFGHGHYQQMNGYRTDYSSSTTTTETPNTDQSASTPATSTSMSLSIADRMSIDGLTNAPMGVFICKVNGCGAPPFQTQYLLNSHANVHSSARPHYCPVQGCSRAEGGKGFKRKNEMIRHGLVHDSPGYVCPFCPDREHKYPRPDNLQRHVRVHHVDKDKDDPALRDVLAQRPDGPNRGRRRRGIPP